MKRLAPALLLALVLVPIGTARAGGGGFCVAEPPTDRRGNSVDMKDYCFFPNVLRIDAGDSVTFENLDAEAHTITGVGLWGGGHKEYATGDKATFSFRDEGTYLYSCLLHPGMVGAVVVGDGKGMNVPGASVVKGFDGPIPVGDGRPSAAAAPATSDAPSNTALYLVVALVALAGVSSAVFLLARARRSNTAPTTAP